jgi:transposase
MPGLDAAQIYRARLALANGTSPKLVAARFGISTMSIYRLKLAPKRKKVRKPKKLPLVLFSTWKHRPIHR